MRGEGIEPSITPPDPHLMRLVSLFPAY